MPEGEVWKTLMVMATDSHFRLLYGNNLNLSIEALYSKAKTWLQDRRQFEYYEAYTPFNPLKLSDNIENCASLDVKYRGLLIKNRNKSKNTNDDDINHINIGSIDTNKVKPVPVKVLEISPSSQRLDIVAMLPNQVWRYFGGNKRRKKKKNKHRRGGNGISLKFEEHISKLTDKLDIYNSRSYLIVKFVDCLTTVNGVSYNKYHFDYGTHTRAQMEKIMRDGIMVAGVHYEMLFYSLSGLYEKSFVMVSKDLLAFSPQNGWNRNRELCFVCCAFFFMFDNC